MQDFSKLDSRQFILIKGAKEHNLKNIDVAIPRNKLVVITGLSGSGKSSLAFDTLYAEGQRRYVESLSSYARQFLGKIEKPAVEYIKGVSPAIAIEQKVSTRSSRSTVGTSTEIYDYLKLLFARIGKTYSPISNEIVTKDRPEDVYQFIHNHKEGTRVLLCAPFILRQKEKIVDRLKILFQQGYSRLLVEGEVKPIEEVISDTGLQKKDLNVLIDRFTVQHENEDNKSRVSDSIETAYYEGNHECIIYLFEEEKKTEYRFNNRFEKDGLVFEEPTDHFFTFNNPVGACKRCEGLGSIIGVDEDLVIPDKTKSIFEGAIACWKGEKMSLWKDRMVMASHQFNFPVHKPIKDLTPNQYELIWTGNEYFQGLNDFFEMLEQNAYKIQYRVMMSRYRGKTQCPECKGTRLRKDANYVKIGGRSITDIVLSQINHLPTFFYSLELSEHDRKLSERVLTEINTRIKFLLDVGLGYLTLNRLSSSLSGGESQRINLATSMGSSLVGSLYILDEPSIGLHPRDTKRLIGILENLRDLGNTVIVVEHEEDIMLAADEIIDLGPEAGTEGGQLVFQGSYDQLPDAKDSLTAKYLTGKESILTPRERRHWKKSILINGAAENNLKNIDVQIPLGIFAAVSGVSGSGKSSLINRILFPALRKHLGGYADSSGKYESIDGDLNAVGNVEYVDQNPIGKSSRSNPVTYVKAFDEIRTLFSSTPLAKSRGFKPSYFSFNTEGGRCETCKGEGSITVEMQFMPDVRLNCEACGGKRYTEEVLEIQYNKKSISDILSMTIDDACTFFSESDNRLEKKILSRLSPLQDVGLGYVQLGQSSNTLSGGEAQRIKLASFLIKGRATDTKDKTLFIFDEPTTGLHFHDIKKLLKALNSLIDLGHSVLVIEHNSEVLKSADWIIDLGPEGGENGGNLVFAGVPEDLCKVKGSHTGLFLKEKI